MRSAEDWLIYIESTETVEWTKWLRDAKGVIEEIQRDALEAAAIAVRTLYDAYMNGDHGETGDWYPSPMRDLPKEIRAMKPEALK